MENFQGTHNVGRILYVITLHYIKKLLIIRYSFDAKVSVLSSNTSMRHIGPTEVRSFNNATLATIFLFRHIYDVS